jgi:hypothetical protein
MSMGGHDTS